MTAGRAEAVELKAVVFDSKSIPGSDFLLEPLDLLILKFHDLLATGADEVVVVALMRDIVVLRLRTEVSGLCEAGIAEQIERPIDGREPKMGISFSQLVIHGFRGDVFLPEKGAENQLTLACELELMFPQVLLQSRHFFHMLPHHGPPIGPH